jgi:Zn-dependent protease/predicted transcriptional regulator
MPEQRRNGSPGAGLGPGLVIARIAGIDIRLHWTWAPAAVFIALSLADGVFPEEVGGLSSGAYLAMGITTTLLFFASLLLHELGHALEARREGLPTGDITLWMLGGVAESGAAFPRAGVEARVALAGPLVSAVLGVALVAIGRLAGLSAGIAAVLEWLGWTNLLLLAFNMLPAYPLDGGRVLRAALWRLSGSQPRATRIAGRVSQALSAGLIAVGVVSALLGALSGLWLVFVGWFVMSAAGTELAATRAQAALAGLHVEDVMTPDPVTVSADASADEFLELARRTGHSVFPVLDQRGDFMRLVTVVAAERVPQPRRAWVTVGELTAESTASLALDADADAVPAIKALMVNPLRRATVLRAGRLVGIVSTSDVARAARRRARNATA